VQLDTSYRLRVTGENMQQGELGLVVRAVRDADYRLATLATGAHAVVMGRPTLDLTSTIDRPKNQQKSTH